MQQYRYMDPRQFSRNLWFDNKNLNSFIPTKYSRTFMCMFCRCATITKNRGVRVDLKKTQPLVCRLSAHPTDCLFVRQTKTSKQSCLLAARDAGVMRMAIMPMLGNLSSARRLHLRKRNVIILYTAGIYIIVNYIIHSP